jgi:hypothetical protein
MTLGREKIGPPQCQPIKTLLPSEELFCKVQQMNENIDDITRLDDNVII